MSARTPDVGEARETLPVPFRGEPLEIGFNPEFLRDGLEAVEGGDLLLKLISPLRPGLIQSADGERVRLPAHADPAQRVGRCASRSSRCGTSAPTRAPTCASRPGLTVVSGRNGAGKTNLLEALYFACTGRSCRTANERECVRFGAELTRLVLRCEDDDGAHEVTVGFQPGEPKRLRVDGAPVERLTDVARPPARVRVPARPAGARHRRAGAAPRPPRPGRRRAAPRPRRHPPRLRRRARPAQRADRGDPRRPRRPRLPAGLGRRARPPRHRPDGRPRGGRRGPRAALRRARRGPRAGGRARRSPTGRARGAATAEALAAELAERVDGDLERGFTGHGPHRDDLVLRRDGRDLRAYGSRGQQRLGLLALLLAEREALAEARAAPPLHAARRRHERARRGSPPPARRRARARGGQSVDHHHRPRARARRRGRRAWAGSRSRRAPCCRRRREAPAGAAASPVRRRARRACATGSRPATLLAEVQRCWPEAAGDGLRGARRSPSPSATAWSPWPAARRSGRRSSTCSPSTSSSASTRRSAAPRCAALRAQARPRVADSDLSAPFAALSWQFGAAGNGVLSARI